MSDPQLIVRTEGAVGRLTLNRPEALHALTRGMCLRATEALTEWRADPSVHMVMIDHAGGRGFCAGADVRVLAEGGAAAARDFFRTEYRLNAMLFRYPKPVVAVMDGVVMGGGVGLARPARYRIATERTVFAMPEAALGLFPDVGAGWYLPRLPGSIGMWLALTGARLGAADCLLLGLATDFLPSDRLESLKTAVAAAPERIDEWLAELGGDPGEPSVVEVRDHIDRAFSKPRVEAVMAALADDGSDWAKAQFAVLSAASPTTLKVAFRQIRLGAQMVRFEDEMAMEYRIASRIAVGHDFAEGVRARLVDKDHAPSWEPATLEAVDDDRLEAIFAPLGPEEWSPLS